MVPVSLAQKESRLARLMQARKKCLVFMAASWNLSHGKPELQDIRFQQLVEIVDPLIFGRFLEKVVHIYKEWRTSGAELPDNQLYL